MTVLVPAPGNAAPQADQPYLEAISQTDSAGHATDRVYVGNEDVTRRDSHLTPTAAVDLSQDATGTPPAGFQHDLIAQRSGIIRNGPTVRPIVHPDGTVYAATHEWTKFANTLDGKIVTANVVVVRDDDWGTSPKPFTALIDPGDHDAGVRVVTGRTGRFDQPPTFGQERVGLNLSIAVDPRTSDVVYIAWSELSSSKDFNLHVRRSGDRGATWSEDLHVVTNATNPALAINSWGQVAFLYQALTDSAAGQRWDTHVELTTDDWLTPPTDFVLATVPSDTPVRAFFPYIGDYVHIMAVERNFFGVFSANNTPNDANFPSGVRYQRNADFNRRVLLDLDNTTLVDNSIDPFFFAVTPAATRRPKTRHQTSG